MDKNLARIEAKLDAVLDKLNVEYKEPKPKAAAPVKLSAAEQQAIDNAPKTPTGASEPAVTGPRVEATTNAPVTPAASPHGVGGKQSK